MFYYVAAWLFCYLKSGRMLTRNLHKQAKLLWFIYGCQHLFTHASLFLFIPLNSFTCPSIVWLECSGICSSKFSVYIFIRNTNTTFTPAWLPLRRQHWGYNWIKIPVVLKSPVLASGALRWAPEICGMRSCPCAVGAVNTVYSYTTGRIRMRSARTTEGGVVYVCVCV